MQVQELWRQKWVKVLTVILLIVVFLLSIYWIGIRKGKGKKYSVELPNGGTGIPVETTTNGDVVTWNPEPLAKEGYEVMSGVFTPFFSTKRVEWYGKLMALTDDQLVAVSNAFNTLYLYKGDGTMKDWIEAEQNVESSQAFVEIQVRLDKLNLSNADPKDL